MIRHELYKIFSQKIVYIAFSLLIGLQVFQFFNQLPDIKQIQVTRQAFQQYGGLVTDEKLNWAIENKELYGNNSELAQQIEDETDPIAKQQLREQFVNIRAPFEVAIDILKLDENIQHRKESVIRIEQKLAANEPPPAYDQQAIFLTKERNALLHMASYPSHAFYKDGWRNILNYFEEAGHLLIGAMIIISVAGLYSREYNVKMDALLLSSRYGRSRAPIAKIIAVIMFSCIVVITFFGIEFLCNAFIYGLDGIDKPLVNVTSFFSSTLFPYSIGYYIVVRTILVCIGTSSLALFVLFISAHSRTPLVPAFAGGFVFLLPFAVIFMESFVPYSLVTIVFIAFRFFEFLQFESFADYSYVNIFGYAVEYTSLTVTQAIVYILLTSILIIVTMRKRQVKE
ncbi:hypothetical protein ACFSTH_08785 [Paenibacillus yanchengensis]|uniref:ABC transporter permease subunit n=1 Tax=Paenibacillus yanchengensis TaxID=2035833 RepID=A0ABW4YKQ5_9BACL